jgi:tetratricopeptide (TPR) repeat protein
MAAGGGVSVAIAAMRRAIAIVIIVAAASVIIAMRGRLVDIVHRQQAARLYQARSWHEAERAFEGLIHQATVKREPDALPLLDYNLGTTDYRLGRFDAAVQTLHAALAGEPKLAERAYYNLGNTYVWQARSSIDHATKRMALRGAVSSFEEALVLDPNDRDAKWNLEVALRRLQDATEPPSMLSRHQNAADWGGGNLTKAGYAGNPQTAAGATPGGGFGQPGGGDAVPDIDEAHARALLNAVERAQVSGQELNGPLKRSPRPARHEPDY